MDGWHRRRLCPAVRPRRLHPGQLQPGRLQPESRWRQHVNFGMAAAAEYLYVFLEKEHTVRKLTPDRPNMAGNLRLLHRRLHFPVMDNGHCLPGLRVRVACAVPTS